MKENTINFTLLPPRPIHSLLPFKWILQKPSVDLDSEKPDKDGNLPSKPQSYSPFLLLPPALFDIGGTSVMYVALTMTNASSFQMLRGSILIFVGIMSVIFLKRKLEWFRWLGMGIILCGLVTVGVSDFLQVQKISTIVPNLYISFDLTIFYLIHYFAIIYV